MIGAEEARQDPIHVTSTILINNYLSLFHSILEPIRALYQLNSVRDSILYQLH